MILTSCVLVFSSCGKPAGRDHSPARAAEPVGIQSLDVYSDGRAIHLLTAFRSDASSPPELQYRRSDDGGERWTDPVRVDAAGPAPHRPHRGMDPQIAASQDRVLAVWQTRGTGFMDGGPMATALSEDGGRTWQSAANPADDGDSGGHGFIDLAADSGGFHVVWLDDRGGSRGLRAAFSENGRDWFDNVTIDSETCECCWNALASAPGGGMYVLYRDKRPRDMAVALSSDLGVTWKRMGWVGDFIWNFDGCPHVGGGLAFTADAFRNTILHAAVWTGRTDMTGVYYMKSIDGGRYWSRSKRYIPRHPRAAVTRMGDTTAKYPDIAADPAGRLCVVWTEYVDNHHTVVAAISENAGATWSPAKHLSEPGADAAHPKVLRTSRGFQVYWTEYSADRKGNWRSMRVGHGANR